MGGGAPVDSLADELLVAVGVPPDLLGHLVAAEVVEDVVQLDLHHPLPPVGHALQQVDVLLDRLPRHACLVVHAAVCMGVIWCAACGVATIVHTIASRSPKPDPDPNLPLSPTLT